MALKEKALRRLGEKLTAANIPFAAGGEWLRCQLGQSAVYHTFDIVVSSADAARADKVLTKLGMRQEEPPPAGITAFVTDLASAFHRFYGSCRIQGADPAVQQARLALCIGVKNVIFNVLTMFKINVPEKM